MKPPAIRGQIQVATAVLIIFAGMWPAIAQKHAAYAPEYLKYLGGSANNGARGVAVGRDGSVYLIGVTKSKDLALVGEKISDRPSDIEWPGFIQKYDPAGSLVYSSFIGSCEPSDISVDASGLVYIAGMYKSQQECVTAGSYSSTESGQGVFLMKVDLAAGKVIFSAHVGPQGQPDPLDPTRVRAIRTDGTGVYIAGNTYSASFPTTTDAFQPRFVQASHHGFVAKVDPAGKSLIYSTFLEGNKDDAISDMQIDPDGNVILAGSTRSTDFPVTDSALQSKNTSAFANCTNGFVTKLDKTGSHILYSTYLPGSWSTANSLALSDGGDIYVAGSTYYDDFPTTDNAFQRKYRGKLGNIFVVKFRPPSNQLMFSTLIGSRNDDTAESIAIDPAGRAVVVGSTNSGSFPVTKNAYQTDWGAFKFFEVLLGDNIPTDGFVSVLDSSGSKLLYSTYVGGSENDNCDGVAVDHVGNIFVVGGTESSSLPAANNGKQIKDKNSGAGFLFKLRPST